MCKLAGGVLAEVEVPASRAGARHAINAALDAGRLRSMGMSCSILATTSASNDATSASVNATATVSGSGSGSGSGKVL